MFDWFWRFLYNISKTLLRLIDTIMHTANVLVGISPAIIDGEEENLLDYLILSEPVDFAFKACAVLGFMFTIMLAIIAIIKSYFKEFKDGTPGQIGVRAFKAIIMFVAVPVCMIAFFMIGNAFMTAIYKATMQGGTSLGAFLFVQFAEDGYKSGFADVKQQFLVFNEYTGSGYSYLDTSLVSHYVDLSDYNYILSWLVSGVLIYVLGTAFLVFIDRIFSLIILYILAPFSVGSTVLDDGARFKLWRDQVLIKFFSGYGTILALNIYCMIITLIASDRVSFFGSGYGFANFIAKIFIIVGGGLTLKKSMALVGNLIQSGGGSGEMNGATSAGGIAGALFGAATTMSGLHLAGNIISNGWQSAKKKAGEALFGLDGQPKGGGGAGGGNNNNNNNNDGNDGNDGNGNQNNNQPNYQNGENNLVNDIAGNDGNNENNNDNQQNGNQVNNGQNNALNDAIEGNNNEIVGNNGVAVGNENQNNAN